MDKKEYVRSRIEDEFTAIVDGFIERARKDDRTMALALSEIGLNIGYATGEDGNNKIEVEFINASGEKEPLE